MKKNLFFALILHFIIPLQAQVIQSSGENVYALMEIGLILKQTGGSIKVERVIPTPKNDSLQLPSFNQGDEFVMANRMKISTTKALKALYDSLKSGDELKALFKRGDKQFFASFKKRDPNKNEGNFVIKMDGAGGAGGKVKPFVLPELDAIFNNEAKGVTVVGLMQRNGPNAKESKAGEGPLFDDDVATLLNGEAIKTTDDLKRAYDKIKVGEKAQLTVKRKNKTVQVPFTKESSENRRIILN
ncbi:MAG: PDZ domain-containing protein [Chloroherpetonaceae bacterium]|nr:PDZ domain-containing protein [Chloroherpetonaceae bacterium]